VKGEAIIRTGRMFNLRQIDDNIPQNNMAKIIYALAITVRSAFSFAIHDPMVMQ